MNPQVGYLIGLAAEYIQKRGLDDAERLLKQALKVDPKHSEIYRLLGVNYVFKKDLDAALEMFGRSIKVDPKNFLTHSNQGNVYRALYQPELALKVTIRQLHCNLIILRCITIKATYSLT